MRSVIESMDSIYDGSRRLIEMRELIDSTQSILDDYINTKDEGVVIMSLTNGMNLMGIDISYQYIVKGLIFIIAVAFDVRSRKK
ncbi:MAG: hypothetical protein IKO10_12485 [Lachnospiraceae bacterium]|nr:hypothetical protein [Lachnospiraceae bacterium]